LFVMGTAKLNFDSRTMLVKKRVGSVFIFFPELIIESVNKRY